REAFQLVERAKSRTLLERMAGPLRQDVDRSPERAEMLRHLDEIRAGLNWDYERLNRIDGAGSRLPAADATLAGRVRQREQEYIELQRRIELGGLAARASSGLLDTSVRDLQEAIRPDEQLVEFVMTREGVT